MDKITQWKLLAGVLAFLLAFSVFQLTILWTDANYKSRAQHVWTDEICRLNKIIGKLTDTPRGCYIPKVPTVANNVFMQPID